MGDSAPQTETLTVDDITTVQELDSNLTNTKQEVTYYVGSESTGTSGEQSSYSGQYETHPVQPDPMPLEASLSKIEKQWNVDRDPKILAELLYGNKDKDGNWIPYSIRFGVHIDGKTEE